MNRGKVEALITELEKQPKHGVSYAKDRTGGLGWRNPVREDTGRALQGLVITKQPRNILEIGTGIGLSSCYLALGLPEGGHLTTIEFHKDAADKAQELFNDVGLPATIVVGDAMEQIECLFGQFEMVFIDAQKNQYKPYIEKMQKQGLLAPNCTVLADNVIDREAECIDFLNYMAQYQPLIQNVGHEADTDVVAGLLIANIP